MPFDPNTPRSRDEVLLQAIVSGDSSTMGDPRDREEEFVKAIADKETLPDYSEASEGDVLQIGADGPEWGAPSGGASKYLHHIRYSASSTSDGIFITFDFVSEQSTAYTRDTLRDALWAKYSTRIIPCSGWIHRSGNYGHVYSFDFTGSTSTVEYYYSGFKASDMSKVEEGDRGFTYSSYSVYDVIEEI